MSFVVRTNLLCVLGFWGDFWNKCFWRSPSIQDELQWKALFPWNQIREFPVSCFPQSSIQSFLSMLEPVPVQHQAKLVCVSSCSPLVPGVWCLQDHIAMEEQESPTSQEPSTARSNRRANSFGQEVMYSQISQCLQWPIHGFPGVTDI